MLEKPIFDAKALTYDAEFTHSYVGEIQRKRIHQCVSDELGDRNNLEILELNCGTGEDVAFLKKFGQVTSTDISSEMLKVAAAKNPGTDFSILDLNRPLPGHKKYDVIFSNFGGLNCISPERLQELNKELVALLNPGGHMFLVFIHDWSLVEFIYFSSRFRIKKAFRRLNGVAEFNQHLVYYYSKKEIKKLFSSFQLTSAYAVGIFLTGEYMNSWGKRLKIKDPGFAAISKVFGADHFLYHFTKQ